MKAARRKTASEAKERLDLLGRGALEIISGSELEAKLGEGRALRIKLGMDPTAPDLHLGHTIALKKLREFQGYGHTVIALIGDFTAIIGDPSGRSETRKPLTYEEIKVNAQTYRDQVFKILDPERAEIRFNSEWMEQLGVADLIRIASHLSVARLLERDDFEKRLEAQEPLFLHELLYPLIQGYDSVALKADIEIGGTDQKFNMLVGRELQRAFGQPPQVVMTMPLLEGLDGVRKMSKSYGNYIALSDSPEEMFGKLMSVSDSLMNRYLTLLTENGATQIEAVKRGEVHPMDAKKRLALSIVAEYHGDGAAEQARAYFETKFQRHQVPEDVPVFKLGKELWVCELMKQLRFAPSTSEARRLIVQGAVRVDGQLVTDVNFRFIPGSHRILEVGKRRVVRIER